MRFVIDPEVVCWSKVEEETLLLNLETGFYYTLDTFGGWIWESIAGGQSLEEILQKIISEYEVDRDEAERDLKDLVETLANEGMMSPAK